MSSKSNRSTISAFLTRKGTLVFCLPVIFCVCVLFFLGKQTGVFFLEQRTIHPSPLYNLVSLPTGDVRRVSVLLASPSLVDRISGYYSLLECEQVDFHFLIERFESEVNPSVQKVIFFVLNQKRPEKLSNYFDRNKGGLNDDIRGYFIYLTTERIEEAQTDEGQIVW